MAGNIVECVIAIDPGREKCGLAVLHKNQGVMAHEVVAVAVALVAIQAYLVQHKVDAIVIGSGTAGREITALLQGKLTLPLYQVDERNTTELARVRYWQDNPPVGWRKLLPVTLQEPPRPVDDYAAIVIAERFFASSIKN